MTRFQLLFSRPGPFLSGLLVFSCLNLIFANNLAPINLLSDLFLNRTDHTLPGENDQFLDFSYSYSPLLKEKRRSDDDRFNSFLTLMDYKGSISLGNSKLHSKTTYQYDSYCGAVRIDNANYSSFCSQHTHRINSILWYSIRNMNLGMQLGSIIPVNDEIKIKNGRMTDYLRSDLLQYGLMTNIALGNFKVLLYADKQPIHFGYTRLTKNTQPDRFRNFPLLSSIQSVGTSSEYAIRKVVNRCEISASKIKSDREISAKNQMPVELNLNLYKLDYEGNTINNLVWSVSLVKSGGWCSGYSNSFDGMEYFIADSLRINSLYTYFGLKDSLRHTIILEGGMLSLRSPGGVLNLAPFSQWTIFYPVAYRFNDCKVSYFEAGLTAAKLLKIKKFHLDLQLSAHYYYTYSHCKLKKKEIIILFPYYRDMGEKSAWDEKGILFIPQLSIPVNNTAVDLNFTINGIIPVSFYKKRSFDSESESKPKPAEMTGGIKAAISLSIKKKR